MGVRVKGEKRVTARIPASRGGVSRISFFFSSPPCTCGESQTHVPGCTHASTWQLGTSPFNLSTNSPLLPWTKWTSWSSSPLNTRICFPSHRSRLSEGEAGSSLSNAVRSERGKKGAERGRGPAGGGRFLARWERSSSVEGEPIMGTPRVMRGSAMPSSSRISTGKKSSGEKSGSG